MDKTTTTKPVNITQGMTGLSFNSSLPTTNVSSTALTPGQFNNTPLVPTSTIPVNNTPKADKIGGVKSFIVPPSLVSNANNALRASTDSAMATPPDAYDKVTGMLTPYGKQQGLKEVNAPTTPTPEPKSKIGTYLDKYLGLSEGLEDKATTQASLEKEFGVDEKQQNYIDAYNQYQTKKLAYDQQIEQLYNTPGGTKEGVAASVSEISRQNNADLANLAVIANAARGNFEGALDIVDRKVKAQFDPIQEQLDSLEKFIQLNQNDLSESEQLQLQSTLDEKKTKAKEISDAYKGALEAAAQNGAPASVYTAIDEAMKNPNVTSADIFKAVGKYGIDRVAQAQIANLYSQINDRANQPGEGTINGKPQNATQSAANGFADRLNESNVIIDDIGGKFTGSLSKVWIPNMFKSSDRQAFEQAKENFVTAVLRRESGAVISDTEFDREDKKYFPQPGDKPSTVKQKQDARNTAINNLYREANVPRPVLPGQIIESDGKRYKVESDGVTITQI